MNLIIAAECLDNIQPMLKVADDTGYEVLKLIGANDEVAHYVETLRPDALIFVRDEIDRSLLREMKKVSDRRPTPILVFTRDDDQASINAAVKAGATAYVVDCNDPTRLEALLGVAKVRFEEQDKLARELMQTKNALQERKVVERAKGIIMRSKSLSEEQAYGAMRKLAMNHNKRIAEIAEQIVSAAEVLV